MNRDLSAMYSSMIVRALSGRVGHASMRLMIAAERPDFL